MDLNEFLHGSSGPAVEDAQSAPVTASSTVVGAPWELPVQHLSASSVSMFMRCPEQYRQRYILGQKERPGAALVVGSGFHFAQETNFRQKIESHEDIAVEAVVEAFHAGWDREIEKYGGAGEIEWDSREAADTLRSKGAALSAAYRTQVSPALQPQAVELGFLRDVEGIAVPFKGFIDFVGTRETGVPWEDGFKADETVIDYKTAKAVQRALKPEWGLQARLYQLETGLPVEYHVATKTKEPQIVTPVDAPALRIEVSDTALNVTTRLLQRVTRQMELLWGEYGPDTAWPGAITHPWACGFCGFRPNCVWQQS